jgi:thiol:disulfide interchange protein DsbD
LGAIVATFAAGIRAQNPVSLTMTVSPASVPAGGKGTARINASIGGGWNMYSITQGGGGPIPTRISLGEGPFKIGAVSGPRPKVKLDPNFGINTESYSGSAAFTVPFTVNADASEGASTLNAKVRYQVCNDTVCLPPKTVPLAASLTVTAASIVASPTPTPSATPTPTASPTANANSNANVNASANLAMIEDVSSNTVVSDNDLLVANSNTAPVARTAESDINNQPIWGFIWLAITMGALSLLTPCVFPMIPITVSYFTKHGSEHRLGAMGEALVYSGGIILTFTGLGVALAVIFGAAGINQFAASPWINLLIAGIFLAFAFSLLGAYEIGVPSSVLTKLDSVTRTNQSHKIIALLLMGLTFTLTSFTCTAPLVGTVLVAASQGDLFYPIVGMLAFSTVFALPFFILALAPNLLKSMPRSGSWMNSVKVVMGFLEIGMALKFISNVDLIWGWGIFTREVVIAGWIALSIMIVIYLLGLFRFSHDSEDMRVGLVRVLITICFTTLSFYLLTGLFGASLGEIESFLPPAKPVPTVAGGTTTTKSGGEVTWITNDLEAAVATSKAENKNMFVDFTGYTCTNCRWMEANMFTKPAVNSELKKFALARLYTDGEGEPYEGYQKMQEQRFGTVALPLYAIISPTGRILATFEGLTRNEQEFITFLQKTAPGENTEQRAANTE